MQAEKHDPAVRAQALEEIEHEPDVAVLRVELRFVEKVHVGRGTSCPLKQERGARALEGPDLVRLVVMNRQAIALTVADAMNILAHDAHPAGRREIAAGNELEECRLAGTVRPHDADDGRLLDDEIRLERKRHLAVEHAAGIALGERVDAKERGGHRLEDSYTPSSRSRS
jgi:hypothetical protein